MYNLYYGMDGGKGSRLIEFSTPENGVIYDNPLDNVVETIAGAIEKESDCYALLGRKIENPAKGEMYIRAGRLRIER